MSLLVSQESTMLDPEMLRPESSNSGLNGFAINEKIAPFTLADPPNLCNMEPQMTQIFRKIYCTQTTNELLRKHPIAYILLSYIALNAIREDDGEGLLAGDCIMPGPDYFGLPPKKYRNAVYKLLEKGLVTEVYNKHSRKKEGERIRPQRAIKRAIETQVLNLSSSTIYDINLECEGERKDEPRANEGRHSKNIKNNKSKDLSSGEAKPKAKKSSSPKTPKPEPTAEELELKRQRKITMDIAQKIEFPLAPSEINAQIKKYSLEAVRFVINHYANGGFKDTKSEHLKGSIYKRIQTEHDYNEEFNENDRDPYAA